MKKALVEDCCRLPKEIKLEQEGMQRLKGVIDRVHFDNIMGNII